MTEQREITKEYFKVLTTKKHHLLERAQSAPSSDEFSGIFDHIIQINRLQMGLLPQMYPNLYRRKK